MRISRALLNLIERQAAQRVVDHCERIVSDAQNAGDVARRYNERLCAYYQRRFAKLLERDAVMQTAR